MSYNILHIDSSPRGGESVGKKLAAQVVEKLKEKNADSSVTYKDLSQGVPFVDGLTLAGFWSAPDQHSEEIKQAIAPSEQAIEELVAADVVVLSSAIWNFGIPASVKAWVDLVVRNGKTFHATAEGYQPALPKGKKAYLVMTSGGVPVGSDYDMASSYLKHIFGFMGITDVEVIAAESLQMPNGADNIKKAEATIAAL